MRARNFLPPLALLGWAAAAYLGFPHEVLRYVGPLVTGVACAIHVSDEMKFRRKVWREERAYRAANQREKDDYRRDHNRDRHG